jgi:hypothetical protein
MPPLVCPRCQRLNPGDAVYCYHDGNLLRMEGVKGTPATGLLTNEFVFPSKRRCATLDDFVQGCQYEWEEARDLLKQGEFSRYFDGIGRKDLARAARDAEKLPDPDIALHTFLGALPASSVKGPKLDVLPRRIILNKVKPGEVKQVEVKIVNQGNGLLQGKLTVTEGSQWFRVAFGGDSGHCDIKTAQEDEIVFVVDTRTLAAPASYSARLTVITNGGVTEVPIRLDLGATPFAIAPFKGASTPREMAERMRANPKGAVPLLENGEIQKWFTANGWAFPSMGVPTRGIAAVQQFFEGMGLSKPPALHLTETEVNCLCVFPEVVPRQVILFTQSKKWVYAVADTDVYWLKILTPQFSGPQQATLAFEVDSSLMEEGEVHQGYIHLTANAGQQMSIRVIVDVQRPPRRGLFGSLFKMALIAFIYRLFLALPGDLFARVLATRVHSPPTGTMARWAQPAASEEGYLRLFVLATWWLGAIAGGYLLWKRRGHWSDVLTGTVAGGMLGVAAAVTVACLATVVDLGPSLLATMFSSSRMPAGVATVFWLIWVLTWWTGLGAAAGAMLPALGRRGRVILATFALPLTWTLNSLGLNRPAAYLAGKANPIRQAIPAAAARGWAGPVVATGGMTRKG